TASVTINPALFPDGVGAAQVQPVVLMLSQSGDELEEDFRPAPATVVGDSVTFDLDEASFATDLSPDGLHEAIIAIAAWPVAPPPAMIAARTDALTCP